jgi:hypothetical protein
MYHGYAANQVTGRAPSQPEDLLGYGTTLVKDKELVQGQDPFEKAAFDALKAGEIVLIWDADFSDAVKTPAGTAGTILGYEKNAPISGGLVLMMDNSVRAMTAEEFQATPKVKRKPR